MTGHLSGWCSGLSGDRDCARCKSPYCTCPNHQTPREDAN